MILSMAAVGLGVGLGGSSSSGVPIPEDGEDLPPPTPVIEVFDAPAPTIDGTQPHVATITTNRGEIEIDLSTDAPEWVNSFAFLAGKGFYNGTTFFYADEYFAQAGDPSCSTDEESICSGVGGPGYTLTVEDSGEHTQWSVVAPAISTGEGSVHGSQFRVLFQDDPRLDGQETVFGTVVSGQDILEGIGVFEPCSFVDSETCEPDMSGALVIENVEVRPA